MIIGHWARASCGNWIQHFLCTYRGQRACRLSGVRCHHSSSTSTSTSTSTNTRRTFFAGRLRIRRRGRIVVGVRIIQIWRQEEEEEGGLEDQLRAADGGRRRGGRVYWHARGLPSAEGEGGWRKPIIGVFARVCGYISIMYFCLSKVPMSSQG